MIDNKLLKEQLKNFKIKESMLSKGYSELGYIFRSLEELWWRIQKDGYDKSRYLEHASKRKIYKEEILPKDHFSIINFANIYHGLGGIHLFPMIFKTFKCENCFTICT